MDEPGQGLGLGLAVVHDIVKAHGGRITVNSKPGEGTTLSIHLPAATEQPTEKSADAIEPTSRPSLIRRVLVVDDEEQVLRLSQLALQMAGFQVITAAGGTEALQLYSTHQKSIDAVVLDLMMPDLSGEQVLASLRQLNPDVRVVICSAYASNEDSQALLTAGARAILFKPFRIEDLVRTVQQTMT